MKLFSGGGTHMGRRTCHKGKYLKFDEYHYKNRVHFNVVYDFEYKLVNNRHIPIACGFYIKWLS